MSNRVEYFIGSQKTYGQQLYTLASFAVLSSLKYILPQEISCGIISLYCILRADKQVRRSLNIYYSKNKIQRQGIPRKRFTRVMVFATLRRTINFQYAGVYFFEPTLLFLLLFFQWHSILGGSINENAQIDPKRTEGNIEENRR